MSATGSEQAILFCLINNRMLVIASSIAGLIYLLTTLCPILRYFVYTFFVGAFGVTGIYVSLVLLTVRKKAVGEVDVLRSLKPLALTKPKQWDAEAKLISADQSFHKNPLYPPSFLISEALDTLLDLVVKNFVSTWYSAISSDPSFPTQVEKAIHHLVEIIRDRILETNVVEVIVGKIVPLLTAHLSDVSDAEKLVRGKHLNNNLTESEELDLAIAGKYRNGNLHPAASLSFPELKLAQQDHLRQSVEKIIPLLLPENELRSRAVGTLVREIIACAVLFPLLDMLSDPDTWNELVAAAGKSTLQDRKTVRKLRAALDEHATPSKSPKNGRPPALGPCGKGRVASFVKLQPSDDERTFEKFIRSIRLCNNLSDARRMRNDISSQLKRDSRLKDPNHIYIRRLETGKRLLDQRVAYLAAGSRGGAKQPTDAGPIRRPSGDIESAKLADILRDPSGLSYFMEHMDRQTRLPLVQFWLVVDGLRNPLEDDLDEDEEEPTTTSPWTESDRNDLAQVYEAYFSIPDLQISEKARKDMKAFLRAGSKATTRQYHKARGAMLRAQSAVLEMMEQRDLVSFKNSDLYYKYLAADDLASTSLVRASSRTESPTLEGHANPIMSSRHSFDDISSENYEERPDDAHMSLSIHSLDPAPDQNAFPSTSVGPKEMPENGIVETMESILNKLIDEQPEDEDRRDRLFPPSPGFSSIEAPSPRSSLDVPLTRDPWNNKSVSPTAVDCGNFSTIKLGLPHKPKDCSKNIASLGLVNPYSRGEVFSKDDLFPEDNPLPEYEIDEDTFDSRSNEKDEDEIQEAVPGDLGLAEAITALTYDIEKLITQEQVVDSLTRKAELTNNSSELRILRKSKASLQREIRRKELQRQQYIVQESDNSLYGRSTIRIKQSRVGKENGKEYALYIVEVHRNAREHMPAAQWVVARRYSEFFQLHQNLRAIFPQVRELDFPRRRVVLHLQKDFLEKRRVALEKYLNSLLLIPEVCRSREFRGFLSQRTITAHLGLSAEPAANGDKADLITRLYNSISDVTEDVLGNFPMLEQLSTARVNITPITAGQATYPFPLTLSGAIAATNNSQTLSDVAEAEAELSAFEDKEAEPFVKPICDLFLEAFELNKGSGSNWLRGRAVVVVLHQLLGGTIEKKVREQVKALTQEEAVLKYIQAIKDSLFQGNGATTSNFNGVTSLKQQMTAKERQKIKNEASIVLCTLIPDVAASVVGRANATAAARRLFAALNNQRLNTSIVFTLFDVVVDTLFGKFIESQTSK